MKALWIALAMLTFGCAARHPTRGEAVRAAEIGIKSVAVAPEANAAKWNEAAKGRLTMCESKNLPTAQDRIECLGPYTAASEYASEARALGEAYDRVVEALDALREATQRLDAIEEETTLWIE